MKTGKQPHVLATASNLLGICLVIVTGLKLSNVSAGSYADEMSLFAAFSLVLSCVLSYLSLATEKEKLSIKMEWIADILFLIGLLSLFVAICFLALAIE